MGNNGGCDPFYMGWEKFLEEMKCLEVRNSNTLQCSCLENLRDGVAQSPTRLKWLRSERYFTLEELFSSECASQSPRGLVKMDRWALQGVWFHRLEWGPIICFFFFFPLRLQSWCLFRPHFGTYCLRIPREHSFPRLLSLVLTIHSLALYPSMTPFYL